MLTCIIDNIKDSRPKVSNAIRVRTATLADVEGVARVCGEAFGTDNFGTAAHVAELKHLAPSLQKLERDFEASIIKNMTTSIKQALELKAEAAAEHRILKLSRTSLLLAARLARQEGRTAVFPGVLGPSESRRAEARLLRYRKFMVLVAVDSSDNQVVGTVSLTLAQAEALLPPPFPSFAPFRPYVANMAVRKSHRRQGVARALLRAAARVAVAKRWGAEAVWLHVQHRREAALGLYLSEGFQPAPPSPGPFQLPTLKALTGELLLRKALRRHVSAARAGQLSGPAQRVVLGAGVGIGGELQEQGQGQAQGQGEHSPDPSTHHDHNPSLSPSPSLTLGPRFDSHPNHSPAASTHPWTAPTQPSSKHTLTPPHQTPDQPPSPSGVRVLVAVDGSTQGVGVSMQADSRKPQVLGTDAGQQGGVQGVPGNGRSAPGERRGCLQGSATLQQGCQEHGEEACFNSAGAAGAGGEGGTGIGSGVSNAGAGDGPGSGDGGTGLNAAKLEKTGVFVWDLEEVAG
ncbi:hypothetical protein QJQ45_024341 [Haematococcus lacustris]|nr:hypothetical protein QJQ45_024341 [Haematococcus lacustris]